MATRIVFNTQAFRELRTLPAMWDDVTERAERIAAACGDGFEAHRSTQRVNRAGAIVITATAEARARNARENTLIVNLTAGR